MTKPATHLHDAEPAAWRGEKRPEPTPEQTKLFRACAALSAAQEAVRTHDGARSGPAWARKTEAFREAWDQFNAVFRAIKGEEG
ncbi:MAG: hypothetical protein JWQ97_3719 [Phenylobacterium sp.]|nr:hypothetical protein [Phenylobacterium sp.]